MYFNMGSLYSVEWTTGMDYPLTLNLNTKLPLLSQSGCGIVSATAYKCTDKIMHGHHSHKKEV